MKEKIKIVFYSPTGTTYKIVHEIAVAMGDVEAAIDITQNFSTEINFSKDDVVIVGVPVYAGRVPSQAQQRLKKMQGQGALLVAVVVYGNRAFEDALLELADVASESGLRLVAAGAFVGEHSFSSERIPIAQGRPDKADLRKAAEFGRVVKKKIESEFQLGLQEQVPGSRPYRETNLRKNISPDTDQTRCFRCGICVKICPNYAIILDTKIQTYASRCMMCCACIKSCPENARNLDEKGQTFARKLSIEQADRKEPVWFHR